MKTLSEWEEKLSGAGLRAYFEAMKPYAKNGVRFTLTPQEDGEIPVGASKLGGCPDLPAALAWPRSEGADIPLSFLCQLNLRELAPYDRERRLPERGMLYFFYDCSEDGMPWGFDPADADGWAVRYWAEDEPLTRAEAPADLEENGQLFGAAGLRFEAVTELPGWESSLTDLVSPSLSDEEQDRLWELLDTEGDGELINKALGHADNIQSGMELECEMLARGLYAGDGSGYRKAEELGLLRRAGRWNLLLQVDSNEELDMCWGDVGRLYFWITEEDLAARDFEKAWLILQCY